MKKNIYFILLIFFYFVDINSKVIIFTHAYNQPSFIKIQYCSFKKFLKDDYEFIVFNDAVDKKLEKQINEECEKNNIKYIRIPQEIHSGKNYVNYCPLLNVASLRNYHVVQWSLENFGFKYNDILVIIDSDIFLTKYFSIENYMKNADLAGWLKWSHPKKVQYIWIGLVFINLNTLKNKNTLDFSCGKINNSIVDAGGFTYYYLQNNLSTKFKEINRVILQDLMCNFCKNNLSVNCTHNLNLLKKMNFDKEAINFIQEMVINHEHLGVNIEFFLDNIFMHYRGGTNHNNASNRYLNKKKYVFNKYINSILNRK